ncbi:MAG: helicase HerA-like domain-containing protein, partial [Bacteroidia bacterium]
ERIKEAEKEEHQEKMKAEREKARKVRKTSTSSRSRSRKAEPTFIEEISKNTMVRQVGRTVARELTRGLLGILGIKKRR